MPGIPAIAPKRILLIKLRHHGDMLLTTPVINALHQRYPQAEIDVLLYKETVPMLTAHPAVRQLQIIDRNWKKAGTGQQLKYEGALVKSLRQRHYDLVINLADQWRSAILTRLTGAQVRIGFDFEKRRSVIWRHCHTHLVPTTGHNQLHTVEQNLSALAPLGITGTDYPASMHYSSQDKQHVATLLAEQHLIGDYIVIQPTSRWTFKCWDDAKVAELMDGLVSTGLPIVMTSGPDKNEREMIAHILSLTHNPAVISLAGQLSLTQLAAVIDGARLFIGVDSAPMHMAAALDTPCVALFGPTKLQHWRPWGKNNQVIWAGDYASLPDPDAIDTGTEKRYLSAIPVNEVLDAARSML